LNSGIGPRLLRLDEKAVVWLEGKESSYSPGLVADNDWAEAAGTTLEDYSMVVSRLTLNSMGNLLGVLAKPQANSLVVFTRTGREASSYAAEPTEIAFDSRLQLFGGRGNFTEPNRTIGELRVGSWIMCNGYRSRDGVNHATQCYLGNELPPEDTPDWLLAKLANFR
jgi:hypothetical protein